MGGRRPKRNSKNTKKKKKNRNEKNEMPRAENSFKKNQEGKSKCHVPMAVWEEEAG